MKFSHSQSFTAAVDEVYRARCEQGVREQACKASGALSWDVQVKQSSGDCTDVAVTRVLAPDLPAMYKSLVGDRVTVIQRETWVARPDGTRRAEVHVSIGGQPATMVGTSTIAADPGGGCTELTEGEVKVAVPLFGAKIEPEIAKVLASALKQEQHSAQEWIAGTGNR